MPSSATFGAWMELRPGHGRQPDPSYYAECLDEAGVVDLIAGGRLVLGFGNGYVEREFDAFGVDRARRGQLMEEKVAYLRRAFSEGVAADGPDGTDLPVG